MVDNSEFLEDFVEQIKSSRENALASKYDDALAFYDGCRAPCARTRPERVQTTPGVTSCSRFGSLAFAVRWPWPAAGSVSVLGGGRRVCLPLKMDAAGAELAGCSHRFSTA